MRRIVWIVLLLSTAISVASLVGLATFIRSDATARPADVPYWTFWLPWIVAVGNVVYIGLWATLTTYAIVEQTLIRRVQFHPVLETRFVWSVDEIGERIAGSEVIADEYAELAMGQPAPKSSDIELRYLILTLKNRGDGIIDNIDLRVQVTVPGTNFRKTLDFNQSLHLAHNEEKAYVIAPIWNLPRFEVGLKPIKYSDYFGSYTDVAGQDRIAESRPYDLPDSQKKTLLIDEFTDQPVGRGWLIDYWGKGEPTDLMRIEHTKPNRHVLVFRGTQNDWDQVRGNKNQQSGAYLDLTNVPKHTTFEIVARARSIAGTTAKLRIWCHDIHWLVNNKDRSTEDITPSVSDEFDTVRMFYTTTDSGRLRVHLHYIPGEGAIEIDKVSIRQLLQ